MAKPRQPAKKTAPKSKKASAGTPDVDLGKLLAEKLSKQPLGKSLSVLEQIYQDIDDLTMRLDLLIYRIQILKKRTLGLKRGEFIDMGEVLNLLEGTESNLTAKANLMAKAAGDTVKEAPEAPEDTPVEWVKLKLLKETEINGIKLSAESTVAVEQIAAKKLIEDGMAEAVEEPAEETA
ncbi:hypothetical protein GN241_04270 [Rhodobacteraceae bacterium IMCC1335]